MAKPQPQPDRPGRPAERPQPINVASTWPVFPAGAFYGPLGEAARLIEPLTEADPVAILVQLQVAFGNAVGRGPRIVLGNVRQHGNLFAVVVGKSAKSRKGTSWQNASEVVAGADEAWARDRVKSGLSSGEGVIHAVRDPLMKREAVREEGRRGGRVSSYQEVEDDPGEADKRLLVVEGEFARALRVAGRENNILSTVLRDAWDNGNLQTMTRSPYKATGAHVSVIGHITKDELRQELSSCDSVNGFANRFLWICAKRSKELPFGDQRISDAASGLTAQLATAVRLIRARGADFVITMDTDCRARWREVYSSLSADRPGLVGSVLNRAEAQVLRLALVYALADAVDVVRLAHLEAALALWRYAEESSRCIFGDALGNSTADEILRVLRETPQGMTRDEIRDHFSRHLAASRLTEALTTLAEYGLARGQKEPSRGGRPSERWFAISESGAESAESAEAGGEVQPGPPNGANRAFRATPPALQEDPVGVPGSMTAEVQPGSPTPWEVVS